MAFLRRPTTGFFCSAFLIFCLLFPLIQRMTTMLKEATLYGYTDPIAPKPKHYLSGFFNKSLQPYLEQSFNKNLGFKAFLIRSYNDINFKLFNEANNTRLKLVTTSHHGLYSNLSINSLNKEIIYRKEQDLRYQTQAKKLYKIQQILAKQDKYFLVVLASSKAYIYPQELGQRYLVGGSEYIFKRKANFGRILKKQGVNVIDAGPILRKMVRTLKIDTHPNSGVHWNYYAACVLAEHILATSALKFPSIARLNCGPATKRLSPMNDVDVDGYLLLNIWSAPKLLKATPYPVYLSSQYKKGEWHPNILMIGDSFSDQIRFALNKTHIPNNMVMSNYFQTREMNNMPDAHPGTPMQNQARILKDIPNSDIVILEMVDYNATDKNTYGFADYFLKNKKIIL